MEASDRIRRAMSSINFEYLLVSGDQQDIKILFYEGAAVLDEVVRQECIGGENVVFR